jgi:23S rRNA pseudouridine2605 synthase
MEERLQKILARAGYGSRRANEVLIEAGRVRVNGAVAVLGAKADQAKDTITVDGTALPKVMPEFVYIALHKPKGVLSDEDPNEPDPRPTVRDLVPVPGHLFAVGRLDYDSEGLILMTNDGDLANRLTHPRYEHEKEYRVQLAVHPDQEQLDTWRRGVVLEDGFKTAPAKVTLDSFAGKGAWITVVLKEGRKRQIREVGRRIGLPVFRIMRVRIGTLELGGLKPRDWRHLTPEEVRSLKGLADRNKPVRSTRRPNRNASYVPYNSERKPTAGKAGPSSRTGGYKSGAGYDSAPTRGKYRSDRSEMPPTRSTGRPARSGGYRPDVVDEQNAPVGGPRRRSDRSEMPPPRSTGRPARTGGYKPGAGEGQNAPAGGPRRRSDRSEMPPARPSDRPASKDRQTPWSSERKPRPGASNPRRGGKPRSN